MLSVGIYLHICACDYMLVGLTRKSHMNQTVALQPLSSLYTCTTQLCYTNGQGRVPLFGRYLFELQTLHNTGFNGLSEWAVTHKLSEQTMCNCLLMMGTYAQTAVLHPPKGFVLFCFKSSCMQVHKPLIQHFLSRIPCLHIDIMLRLPKQHLHRLKKCTGLTSVGPCWNKFAPDRGCHFPCLPPATGHSIVVPDVGPGNSRDVCGGHP